MVSLIAAVARNRAIGFRNRLLYWLPNDLKRFKALTTGHTIVMGRKTFESLPKGALPNRRNIVLSRSGQEYPGTETFSTLEAALAACGKEEEVFVIGGASVYAQALPLADRLCLTEIADTPAEADAFFPDYADWKEDLSADADGSWHETDEKHAFRYRFVDYIRPHETIS